MATCQLHIRAPQRQWLTESARILGFQGFGRFRGFPIPHDPRPAPNRHILDFFCSQMRAARGHLGPPGPGTQA